MITVGRKVGSAARLRVLALLLGASWGFGCGYTQPVPGEAGVDDRSGEVHPPRQGSPRFDPGSTTRLNADREACELAILATGDVEAPEIVWRTIREDLDNIRQFWSVTMPEIRDITFRPVHEVTSLVVVFDFGAAQQVRERTYDEWDELNREWRARPESIRDLWDGRAEVTLVSDICVDLTYAARDYRFLYGVTEVYPPTQEEDGPTIYIDYSNVERRYLFRDAWGSCWNGCDESRYAFFKISGLAPHFQESFDPATGPTPVWWDEASEIMRRNRDWERSRGR